MTEEEILIRAREAAIITTYLSYAESYRSGNFDKYPAVIVAAQALRDYHKPLSELVPVDPNLVEARKIAHDKLMDLGASDEQIAAGEIVTGDRDDAIIMHAVLAALKRGRELERGQ